MTENACPFCRARHNECMKLIDLVRYARPDHSKFVKERIDAYGGYSETDRALLAVADLLVEIDKEREGQH